MIRPRDVLLFAAILALGALPLVGESYTLRLGTFLCMYAVMSVSWNVIGGLAGYPSFATAAFFGLGAYVGGVLLTKGAALLVALAFAGAIAFGGAMLLGAVLLRLRGHYFAIASLAVAEVLRELTNTATDLTGGGMGLNIPLGTLPAGGPAAEATFFFLAMWGLLLLTLVVVVTVEKSKLGFGLVCIRQNESAADMIGVNATLYKSLAFALSGVFVAMAGTLYAAWVHYIEPPDVYDVLFSVKPIVMALLGGLGSTAGAVLGAFAFLGIEEIVWRNYLQVHSGVLGFLVVVLLLFLPHGLVSIGRRFKAARVRQ
ncbi:branched-chain amino acid ABC transporter permease [Burkholderiaceae bacterium FT117]|uniref:branched-chain amino acid ABC transporter permease n=1 Tax=Zeimonas sediminis TaxID=2944268 RepID=UPI0023431D52|nr:branched-chain amino acid ABC transporter permease [Zeimonas sediminis]MCM5571043.1 branched-chain amino acid ABC transporter permease [Zeimonas sediminis]